jgi:hypothetical protein
MWVKRALQRAESTFSVSYATNLNTANIQDAERCWRLLTSLDCAEVTTVLKRAERFAEFHAKWYMCSSLSRLRCSRQREQSKSPPASFFPQSRQ